VYSLGEWIHGSGTFCHESRRTIVFSEPITAEPGSPIVGDDGKLLGVYFSERFAVFALRALPMWAIERAQRFAEE
jgi:hypothetical protein